MNKSVDVSVNPAKQMGTSELVHEVRARAWRRKGICWPKAKREVYTERDNPVGSRSSTAIQLDGRPRGVLKLTFNFCASTALARFDTKSISPPTVP